MTHLHDTAAWLLWSRAALGIAQISNPTACVVRPASSHSMCEVRAGVRTNAGLASKRESLRAAPPLHRYTAAAATGPTISSAQYATADGPTRSNAIRWVPAHTRHHRSGELRVAAAARCAAAQQSDAARTVRRGDKRAAARTVAAMASGALVWLSGCARKRDGVPVSASDAGDRWAALCDTAHERKQGRCLQAGARALHRSRCSHGNVGDGGEPCGFPECMLCCRQAIPSCARAIRMKS